METMTRTAARELAGSIGAFEHNGLPYPLPMPYYESTRPEIWEVYAFDGFVDAIMKKIEEGLRCTSVRIIKTGAKALVLEFAVGNRIFLYSAQPDEWDPDSHAQQWVAFFAKSFGVSPIHLGVSHYHRYPIR